MRLSARIDLVPCRIDEVDEEICDGLRYELG